MHSFGGWDTIVETVAQAETFGWDTRQMLTDAADVKRAAGRDGLLGEEKNTPVGSWPPQKIAQVRQARQAHERLQRDPNATAEQRDPNATAEQVEKARRARSAAERPRHPNADGVPSGPPGPPDAFDGDAAAFLGEWDGPGRIGFGRDGQPFYLNGPYDNPAAVIGTLERSVGAGNFHFSVAAGPM
ncbi:hypothetical protein [Rhodococcus koreensis]